MRFWLCFAIFSFSLTSCGVLKLDVKTAGFQISISATEPEYDGSVLKSELTVDVLDRNGPVVGYLPELNWQSQLTTKVSFTKKLLRLLSTQSLSLTSHCTVTDSTGRAHCELTLVPPTDGAYELKITIADKIVDFATPLIFYASPTLDTASLSSLAFDQTELLTLTGTQFRTGMRIFIDGLECTGLITVSTTSATCTTPLHALGGPFSLVLKMPDLQESVLANAVVFVDKTPPSMTWGFVPPARSNQESFSFDFAVSDNVTANGNLIIECRLDSGAWISCSPPEYVTGFSDGAQHTFYVRVRDQAGLETILTHVWTFDSTAPTIEMSNLVGFTPAVSSNLSARSLTVSGDNIVRYKYHIIRSGSCGAVDYSAHTEYPISSPTVSFTPTTDGTYVVCAIGKDEAGNWQDDSFATSSATLTIDTVVSAFSSLAVSPAPPSTNATPTVTGTTEANAQVVLYGQASCMGSALASTTANGSGQFSLTPGSALGGDGSYSLSLRATDLAGNTICSGVVAYNIDTLPPSLSFTTLTNTRASREILLQGACENGLEVVFSGDVVGSPSVVCGSNVFSLTLDLSAGEGIKNIGISSTDAAGNTSSTNRNFVRDDTAPLLTIASPTDGARTTGSVTIAGSCGVDPADLNTLQVTGTGLLASPQSTTCTSGSYSLSVTLSATDGPKVLSVAQSDLAGNVSTITRSLVKDTTAPILAISDPADGFRAPAGITLSGNCGAAPGDNATVTISGAGVDGAPLISSCSGGIFTENILFSAGDGVKAVSVTQGDDLGHSTVVSRNFERDGTAPQLSIISPSSSTRFTSTLTLTGSCGSTVDDLPTLTLSGAGLGSPATTTCSAGAFSEVITLTAGEGDKVIGVSQTNVLSTTTTVNRTFVRDETPPVLSFSSPALNDRFQNTLVLEGACGATAGDSGTLSLGGTGLVSPTSTQCVAGAFAETITLSAGEGVKNITVTQIDSAGHSTVINRDFVRDNTAPVVTIAAPLQSTPYQTGATLTGACTSGTGDNATLTISGAGVLSPSATACSGNAYSVNVIFTAGGGTKDIIISQADSAGNSHSATLSLIRDNTNPLVTLTSLTGGQLIKGAQNTAITWTASDNVGLANNPISIDYSLNAGSSWSNIVSNIANTGSYTWNMPGFNSSTARVRVRALDSAGNSTTATSSTNFTIDSSAPLLTLNSLTGGQILRGGGVSEITWLATDANLSALPITLYYSTNEGSSWQAIGTAMANSGSYSWTVPADDSPHYRIRVVATDAVSQSTTVSSSSNIIVDKTAPTVTLTSLTGGQAIQGASNYNITWIASDTNLTSAPITLEYSADSGSSWNVIVSNIANTGSYAWDVGVSDGNTYRVRVSVVDAVGLSSSSSSASNFTVSSSAPNLTQTAGATPFYSNTVTSMTYGGACEIGYPIVVSGAEATSLSCPAGTWSWTTSHQNTDGVRDYTFSQSNGVFTTSRTVRWVRDTDSPTVAEVEINDGSAYTSVPIVRVAVRATEVSQLKIRVLNASTHNGNCPEYADDNWQDQANETTVVNHVLSSGDGLKKVCVWLKDSAGNHSVIAGAGLEHQDVDKIDYSSGSAPTIASFTVINNSGGDFDNTTNSNVNDPLKISWSVADAEGLAENPIYLDYTLDGTTWIPIEAGYGSLGGNPTTYSYDYFGFSAPVNTFFRLRLRVKDMAGNTSLEIYSNTFNTSPWSVFAGSKGRGVGGSGKSTLVLRGAMRTPVFAMNPVNGDVYYIDRTQGLFKVAASTGVVSRVLGHGTGNISGSGVLNNNHRINTLWDNIVFDKQGYLYLSTSSSNGNTHTIHLQTTRRIIRINPATLQYTTYLPGGNYYGNAGTTTDNVFIVQGSGVAFDESNSLYFLTSCTPGSYIEGTTTIRMMKVTQNANGTPGAISVVGGNCVREAPVSGQPALLSGLTNMSVEFIGATRIIVWNNGQVIYYQVHNEMSFKKILNGIIYPTAIAARDASMAYHPSSGNMYVTHGPIKVFTPGLMGANGETEIVGERINGTATVDGCGEDGVSKSNACIGAYGAIVTPAGKLFFTDGNSDSFSLLRYFDDNNEMQTLVGSKSYSGNGKAPSLTRGMFGGLYYKKGTEPLGANHQYPEGLYFTEFGGGVFGYFSEALGVSVNLWGNQSGRTAALSTASNIGTGYSLGSMVSADDGDLRAMAFDSLGRPWLRYNSFYLTTLDENRTLIARQSGSLTATWNLATQGQNPNNFRFSRKGLWQNLTFLDNKIFLLGVHYDSSGQTPDNKPKLKVFDYDNSTVIDVMGVGTANPMQSPPQLTEGSLLNTPIAPACQNSGCSLQYIPEQEKLYIAEGAKLRYITKPLDPNHHTLVDVFDASGTISNFILSQDRKYLFYILNGALYCHAFILADESAVCKNNPVNHINLGPPTGMDTIAKGPNQMTWKNDTTLFISTQKGEIFQYVVYH